MDETLSTVEGLNKLVNSKEAQDVFVTSNQTIRDIGALARKVDTQVVPISSELTKTLKETRRLLRRVNRKVEPVGDEILIALKSTSSMLEQIGEMTNELHATTGKRFRIQIQFARGTFGNSIGCKIYPAVGRLPRTAP